MQSKVCNVSLRAYLGWDQNLRLKIIFLLQYLFIAKTFKLIQTIQLIRTDELSRMPSSPRGQPGQCVQSRVLAKMESMVKIVRL